MTSGTVTIDDVQRAILLSQRAALLAMLPVVIARPGLKAGAVQWLGAIEDELQIERTMPNKHKDAIPLCACGCGKRVGWNAETRRWHRYVVTHAPGS